MGFFTFSMSIGPFSSPVELWKHLHHTGLQLLTNLMFTSYQDWCINIIKSELMSQYFINPQDTSSTFAPKRNAGRVHIPGREKISPTWFVSTSFNQIDQLPKKRETKQHMWKHSIVPNRMVGQNLWAFFKSQVALRFFSNLCHRFRNESENQMSWSVENLKRT